MSYSNSMRRWLLVSSVVIGGAAMTGCANDDGNHSTVDPQSVPKDMNRDPREPFTPQDERITPSGQTGPNRNTSPFTPADEQTTPSANPSNQGASGSPAREPMPR